MPFARVAISHERWQGCGPHLGILNPVCFSSVLLTSPDSTMLPRWWLQTGTSDWKVTCRWIWAGLSLGPWEGLKVFLSPGAGLPVLNLLARLSASWLPLASCSRKHCSMQWSILLLLRSSSKVFTVFLTCWMRREEKVLPTLIFCRRWVNSRAWSWIKEWHFLKRGRNSKWGKRWLTGCGTSAEDT